MNNPSLTRRKRETLLSNDSRTDAERDATFETDTERRDTERRGAERRGATFQADAEEARMNSLRKISPILVRPLLRSLSSSALPSSASAPKVGANAKSRARFDKNDAFNLESVLTEEEKLIRDQVRDFASKELAPRILLGFRNETIDRDLIKMFGSIGILGATIKGYGCPGVSSVASGLITREIERIDSGYR